MQIRTSERNEGNQGKWNFNKNLLRVFQHHIVYSNLNNSYSFEYRGKLRRCIFKPPLRMHERSRLCLLAIVLNAVPFSQNWQSGAAVENHDSCWKPETQSVERDWSEKGCGQDLRSCRIQPRDIGERHSFSCCTIVQIFAFV